MGVFHDLQNHSTKIYSFHQSDVYTEWSKLGGLMNRDVDSICHDGTCAAIASRWTFERANKANMKNRDRMLIRRRTASIQYKQKRDKIFKDPQFKTDPHFERNEYDRLETERQGKKQKMFERYVKFYPMLGEAQAEYVKHRKSLDQFTQSFTKIFESNLKKGSQVYADKRNNLSFGKGYEKLGTPDEFNHLACLKDVSDNHPLYVVYEFNFNNPELAGRSVGAHAIGIHKSGNPPYYLFDPNAGEYQVDSNKWGDFIDEYDKIICTKVFGQVNRVVVFSVRVQVTG